MKKYEISDFILILILILSFFTSSTISQSYPPVKNSNQYIVMKPDVTINSLDPASANGELGLGINNLVCETLYDYTNNSLTEIEPLLANSMPIVSADGLQYNISLKKGVYFSDGTEFNAWTYKFSLDRALMIADPNSQAKTLDVINGGEITSRSDNNLTEAYSYLSAGGIKVLSDYEIQFNLNKAHAPFITVLTQPFACALSPKFIYDHQSYGLSHFTVDSGDPVNGNPGTTATDNSTGMVNLDAWFPALNGNFSILGLNDTIDPAESGVVPSGFLDPCDCSPSQFWYGVDHLVGTGSWILNSISSQNVTLDKNLNWWNKGNFAPNSPDTIIIKAINDGQTRAQSLENGEADTATIDRAYIDQIVDTNKSPKLKTVSVNPFPSLQTQIIAFNLHPGDKIGTGYIDKFSTSAWWWDNDTALNSKFKAFNSLNASANHTNPFTVLRFRQAFAYSLDYEKYINLESPFIDQRMQGLIPYGVIGHQSDLITKGYIPMYDPDLAKALFQEVGWQGSITLSYKSSNSYKRVVSTELKNSIENMDVGIHINVVEEIPSTFLRVYTNTAVFYITWGSTFADPDLYLTGLMQRQTGYFSTLTGYNNSFLDDLITQASEQLNSTQRIQDYANIEKYIAQDYLFMYTAQPEIIDFEHYWINNFVESGSANQLRYFPRVQFLNKQPSPYIEIPNSNTSSTELQQNSIPSNELLNVGTLEFLGLVIAFGLLANVVIYYFDIDFKNRKIIRVNREFKKENHRQKNSSGSFDDSVIKLEEIIDELKEN